MKKRIIWLAIAAAAMLLCTGCTGCTSGDTEEVYNAGTYVASNFSNFETIEGTECLSYDTNTRVVYYIFKRGEYGYMSPYISENGHFCRYIDGEIVEITES